ncbi:unnamed protein product [Aphanomyces euteiches]
MADKMNLGFLLNPEDNNAPYATAEAAEYKSPLASRKRRRCCSPTIKPTKKQGKRKPNVFSVDTQTRFVDLVRWMPPGKLVGKTFITHDKAAPPSVQGYEFNLKRFRNARHKKQLDPTIESELTKLGFVWNVTDFQGTLTIEALECFKAIKGHVNVQQKFVVPADDPRWPKSIWRLKLGHRVHNYRIKRKSSMPAWQREKLDALGFKWDGIKQHIAFEKKLDALQVYYNAYGHLRVPQSYKIPSANVKWDGEPMPLGRVVNKLRQGKDKMALEKRRLLTKMGFVWSNAGGGGGTTAQDDKTIDISYV